METKTSLKQAAEINLNHFKWVARFVFYALLFMVTLTVIEIVFILSAAAGMGWLNWVWTLLILLGITLAIIKRRDLRRYQFPKAVRIATPILLAAIICVIAMIPLYFPATPTPSPVPEPPSKNGSNPAVTVIAVLVLIIGIGSSWVYLLVRYIQRGIKNECRKNFK